MLDKIKNAFTRRILLTASVFFSFVMPLIYLYVKSEDLTFGAIKVRFWVMFFLIIYLIVAFRTIKKYINARKNGILKRFFNSANIMIAIAILYLIVSILEKAFIGADVFFYYFTIFETMGFVCYNADSIINDNWIREREYEEEGKAQARIEYYKEKYKAKFKVEEVSKR